jgi:hypothetical protein
MNCGRSGRRILVVRFRLELVVLVHIIISISDEI